jgi:hypothetical protein
MGKKKKGKMILALVIMVLVLILMGVVKKNNSPQGNGEAPPLFLTPLKLM